MIITLTPWEQAEAEIIGNKRMAYALDNRCEDRQTKHDKQWVQKTSVGGEIAIARFIGVDVIPETGPDEYDLISRKGALIDVKCGYGDSHEDLMVPYFQVKNHKVAPDVFIAATCRWPDYQVRGWCYYDDIINDEHKADYMPLPCFKRPLGLLRSFF